MDFFRLYGNLLRFDGTNQLQRTLPALQQRYIVPDERSLPDLVDYAHSLAQELRFIDLSGQAVGDWSAFFESLVVVDPKTNKLQAPSDLETIINARGDWPPHVALFLVFLKLFKNLQDDLNELPQRHLRYYYEKELGLSRRTAVADQVHVIFEPAPHAKDTLLPAGTALDAGKDAQGRPLSYVTQSELVVSAATVVKQFRLVMETDLREYPRFFVSNARSDKEGASWYTFGRKQLDLDAGQRFMAEAKLGFAIASPLLLMSEGNRSLRITANLRSQKSVSLSGQHIGYALDAVLTGEKGWMSPDRFTAELIPDHDGGLSLYITLSLGEAAGAVVPFSQALHGQGPVSRWPILRILLKGESGLYQTLDGLSVANAELTVEVTGMRKLVLQNAEGLLKPDQPMLLFGSQPTIDSPFYIGSAEVFGKPLSSLTLKLDWNNPPPDLFEHYRTYFEPTAQTYFKTNGGFSDKFVFNVGLLNSGAWIQPESLSKQSLFGNEETTLKEIELPITNFAETFGSLPQPPQASLAGLSRYNTDSRYGFLRLSLKGPAQGDFAASDTKVPFEAFGHQIYPRLNAEQVIAQSSGKLNSALELWEEATQKWIDQLKQAASGNGSGATSPQSSVAGNTQQDDKNTPKLPNPPYTPTLSGFSLDYTAQVDIVPDGRPAEEAFFTLGPFGYTVASGEAPARLVPDILGGGSAKKDVSPPKYAAALYLGVEKLRPSANLSLLFQIDEGTSATDALKAGETQWSYLSGQIWRDFPPDGVLKDSTLGFQKPGLVVLSLGGDATTDHTPMPAGWVWLRALIRRPPESASRTLALHTQAALATFRPETGELNDYDEHLGNGLAAGTVKGLKTNNVSIKKVSQPYASFDGRGGEQDAEFFPRVSERLRHRNRAVTAWDLERLVLDRFPEVFKVKCLPHSDAEGNPKAGEAALVIVPDLRDSDSINRLEPRAGAVLMARIEDYVGSGLATPFMAIDDVDRHERSGQPNVIHPVYERIRVFARVKFGLGRDPGYYSGKLNEDLVKFLSPWAYQEGEDIQFGARIYKSDILAFVEGREYVDYATDFRLYHNYEGPPRYGIGAMTIGMDFIIRPHPLPAIGGSFPPNESQMVIGNDFVVGLDMEAAYTTQPQAILVSHRSHVILAIAGESLCTGTRWLSIGTMTVGIDFTVAANA